MVGLIDTADGARAEWTFPAEPDTVRTARHAVHDTLHAWGAPASLRDMAVLLVSELVTNSLRYTSGPIGVRLAVHALAAEGAGGAGDTGGAGDRGGLGGGPAGAGAALLVEISDPLPEPPTERLAGPEDEGGRGLGLVACSARRWGTRRGKTGKTVWFELPLPG
ncbi:ATP-binding protein [Streptomyces sp. NPDC059092]|uniref:ATP-binding protein n=1 Tax=Streptomyces sp. NPDC059092 TaxID=3346725 RepID=UPI0036A983EA